ncbi:unnamed protein product [Kuraishia capsulata CBS 1993]|uniref:Phosphotransferase n=1 Tax=Kuraishia capsulata CBS 1993 TaxID=1382522 RepID=W6MGV1_9ASCO|nr:uncharacterized protein KUCA_T00000805001 [Kuraishia capsulata CBS 1993]CDK24838.1 unnamed protein product [Kuraishia capsulata CBS 1993]
MVAATTVDLTTLPKAFIDKIDYYEDLFWVTPETLKKVVTHFVDELNKGNSVKGGNIPMIPSWVMEYPDGSETGEYLAIDLGGTNLRVVKVKLLGDHKFSTEQNKYHIPAELRTTRNKDELFDFIAKCLDDFIQDQNPSGVPEGTVYPLGFTFSYPCLQSSIDAGVLKTWTKGFDIPGVEGHNVVPMLMEKVNARKVPVKVVALINDTSGTLVASRYTDATTEMGVIFGTGVNGAYFDRVQNIPKLQGKLYSDIKPTDPMLINCEYGSFDNEHLVLPRTKFDERIDAESPRPGEQAFEKMTAGYYLGELLRMILCELYEEGLVFKDYKPDSEQIKLLHKPYHLDTSFLAMIEGDDDLIDLPEASALFSSQLFIDATLEERKLARMLCQFIGTRAARLSICGISAVCKKMNHSKCHIAADGSVFAMYPHFPERAAQGLADVFDFPALKEGEKEYPIHIVQAQDGSGVGAAIIAALSDARKAKGLSLGLKL